MQFWILPLKKYILNWYGLKSNINLKIILYFMKPSILVNWFEINVSELVISKGSF